MDEKKLKSWRRGFRNGAKQDATRKAEIHFKSVWARVLSLNTFEAELLGEVDGLQHRLDTIEELAGL